MTLPVTIPNTFANATTSIPLANLDANFVAIYDAVNGIGNGAESLANVSITGGTASNVTVEFAAGTNAAPSITTVGDTNTGIFFPAADTIGFVEGGAEAMRIDSSGQLMLGTTTSTNTLSVDIQNKSATSNNVLVRIKNDASSEDAGLIIEGVSTSAREYKIGLNVQENTPDLTFSGPTGYRWYVNGTERARINSDGDLLVGTTSAGTGKVRIDGVTGGVNLFCNYPNPDDGVRIDANTAGSAGTSVYILPVRTAGTLRGGIQWNGSNLLYNNSSDYRLKENIAPMTGALNKVAALKPCTYTWKETGISGQGFIAHELQEIVPDCVTGEKDAVNEDGSIKPQGIDTSFLVATLTAAIQELKAENDALKARLDAAGL